jgi:cyclopropane fatty-acyl-phospholipid synthase-like methyltransferase
MTPRFDTSQIRHFYDRNTAGFLVTGQSNSALHRAVWGPGVTTRDEAFRYIEGEIVQLLRALPSSLDDVHVVDLGCGVGGSLSYLAEHLPIRATGITLSPVQQRIATARFRGAGHSDRLRCLAGDYSAVPDDVGRADLVFAIESFVHATDAAAFVAQCHRLVRPGGLLVIADDFLRSASTADAARTIARFKSGWRVNTLLSAGELETLARAAGFSHVRTTDLTSFVEIRRPRDRFVHGVLSLIGWLPLEDTRLGYLVGGSALQTALARGWIGYDLAVFTREP